MIPAQLEMTAEYLLNDAYCAPFVRSGDDIRIQARLIERLNNGDDPDGEVSRCLTVLYSLICQRDDLMNFSLQAELDKIGRSFGKKNKLAVEVRMAQRCNYDEIEGYEWSRDAWDAA